MSTVIGKGIVLSGARLGTNAGIIAFDNVVNFDNVSATSETLGGPITNLANPATAYAWTAADITTQTITIMADGREVDYIGIARHNLNQPGLTIEVKFNGATVLTPRAVTAIQSQMILFNVAAPTEVEIIITGATDPAKIAVLYLGKAIRLEREIYVGHTPITYGRQRKAINGLSENGQYLGQLVVRETLTTSVSLQNLTPAWYRSTLDAFFAEKPRRPCFWAWRPEGYPDEVGYAWVEGDPVPVNQRSNGMMSIVWQLRGIV
ncbi:MAG: hypothetical protein KAT00_00100 [Planctomycetes bacterium]|nr:hypothetical protein [Planctomycetota bacterium]